jgi:hypothetical protein
MSRIRWQFFVPLVSSLLHRTLAMPFHRIRREFDISAGREFDISARAQKSINQSISRRERSHNTRSVSRR